MKIKQKTIFISIITLLAFGAIITFLVERSKPTASVNYDEFATCLGNKGATFYGAYWCPHCNAQKEAFGSSAKLLPYVECSDSDVEGQLQVCKDKKIMGYPTWVLSNSISLKSPRDPYKCTNDVDEAQICKENYSDDYGVWIIDNKKNTLVYSTTNPVQKGDMWTFAPNAHLPGDLSMEVLSELTTCKLP